MLAILECLREDLKKKYNIEKKSLFTDLLALLGHFLAFQKKGDKMENY